MLCNHNFNIFKSRRVKAILRDFYIQNRQEQRMSLATFSRRARLHLCNIYLSRECASIAERFLLNRKAISYSIKKIANATFLMSSAPISYYKKCTILNCYFCSFINNKFITCTYRKIITYDPIFHLVFKTF